MFASFEPSGGPVPSALSRPVGPRQGLRTHRQRVSMDAINVDLDETEEARRI